MTVQEVADYYKVKPSAVRHAIRAGYLPASKGIKSYEIDPDSLNQKRIVTYRNNAAPLTVKTKTISGIRVIDENTEHFATTAGRDQFVRMCAEAKL